MSRLASAKQQDALPSTSPDNILVQKKRTAWIVSCSIAPVSTKRARIPFAIVGLCLVNERAALANDIDSSINGPVLFGRGHFYRGQCQHRPVCDDDVSNQLLPFRTADRAPKITLNGAGRSSPVLAIRCSFRPPWQLGRPESVCDIGDWKRLTLSPQCLHRPRYGLFGNIYHSSVKPALTFKKSN